MKHKEPTEDGATRSDLGADGATMVFLKDSNLQITWVKELSN